MPTYPYACTVCDHRFEIVQSFSDDALTVCPECSGRLRKVFGSVGVVFKGSGFYRTDSRSASSSSSAATSSSSSSDGAKSTSSSTASTATSANGTSSSSSSSTSSPAKTSAA